MITTIHDFEVIWRIKLSDDFFYFMKTDIVEDKYLKIVGGVEDITDEELEHLEMMVNAVLMENIIDVFEVKKASVEELVFDEEESYNVKCLVEGLSWFGFYSDIFDNESPFEVEI